MPRVDPPSVVVTVTVDRDGVADSTTVIVSELPVAEAPPIVTVVVS